MAEEFDFGFTTESSNDLEQIAQTKANENVDGKASAMYNAIIPLLNSLKKNPENDLIKWPNRVKKIDAFILKLNKIKQQ